MKNRQDQVPLSEPPPTPERRSLYDYILLRLPKISTQEHAQALTRVIISFVVACIMIGYDLIVGYDEAIKTLTAWLVVLYVVLSVLLYLNINRRPGEFRWRHYTAIIGDHGITSFGMFAFGPIGAQFYPVYLWVTIGNGLRFGSYYLNVATFVSAGGFLTAIFLNKQWHEQPNLAVGLLIGMIILPIFFSTILKQLQAAHDKLKTKAQEAEHIATHDALTGLPNRILLEDRLEHAIDTSRRKRGRLAVFFLDLDGFKNVNDSLGHSFGDDLLQQMSQNISASLRSGDTLARLGGDEFIILADIEKEQHGPATIAEKIIEHAAGFYEIAGREIFVTFSIGIAVYPQDGENFETLIRNADIAMYRAKDAGGNQFRAYDNKMSQEIAEQLSLQFEIRSALKSDEFELHYQPIIECISGRLIGAEALARWHHPKRGLLHPGLFIPAAESCDLIIPLGHWALEAACRDGLSWEQSGLAPISFSVNVSALQFKEPGFIEKIAHVISKACIDPRRLQLEITEGVLIEETEQTVNSFRRLKELNVQLSLDDFGTGYSSLSYLKRFALSTIKIDRSFIKDIPGDPNDCALVSSILAIGHNLGIRVVAEGVETVAQMEWLQNAGCDYFQGFYIAKPMPFSDFMAWQWSRQDGEQERAG